ncbi:MAG: energy-coupling factor transporter ATPase [Clostridia bacterium]|nr:energy-coupling factor transporter ATPase [Clostridia bacterium]
MSIEVKNLTHIYGKNGPYEKVAVDNVSCTFEDGEFIGMIGHTGSGKSTLVQHLNGILKPTEGTVIYNGIDIFDKNTDLRKIRQEVGMVFQYPESQLFEETVYKDIAFGLNNYGIKGDEADIKIHNAAKMVDLDYDLLQKSPFELSGGQKRRVALAGVIAMEPKVLILDEPAAGLDPAGRISVLESIKNLHLTRGITVILVSHSMEDMAKYASKLVVMNKGKLELTGSPKEVFKNQKQLFEMGLDVPNMCKVLAKVRALGFDVPESVFDVEETAQVLCEILRREKC